jgi:hypothetical protein
MLAIRTIALEHFMINQGGITMQADGGIRHNWLLYKTILSIANFISFAY